MIDTSNIRVRRVNSQGVMYGDPVAHEDLPWEVMEEVAEAIVERDEDGGTVDAGGQRYWWAKFEPKAPPKVRPEHAEQS